MLIQFRFHGSPYLGVYHRSAAALTTKLSDKCHAVTAQLLGGKNVMKSFIGVVQLPHVEIRGTMHVEA